MAVPAWAQYYLDKNKKQQEEMKASQQAQIWQDTMASRAARKETNGVDPALKNVTVPEDLTPKNKLLRGFNIATNAVRSGATLGAAKEGGVIDKLADKITAPITSRLKPQKKQLILTPEPETNTEKKIAAIGEFAGAALPIGGASKIGISLLKNAPIKSQAIKSLASTAIAGGLYGGAEGAIQGEDLKGIAKNAAINAAAWPAIELGFKGAGKVVGDTASELKKYINAPKPGKLLKPDTLPRIGTNAAKDIEADPQYTGYSKFLEDQGATEKPAGKLPEVKTTAEATPNIFKEMQNNGQLPFKPTGVKEPATLGEGMKTSAKINQQEIKGSLPEVNNTGIALKRERNADVDALNRAKGGFIKARYAPQAMEKPEFQVANAMAEANTGKSIIPVDRFDNAGATFGDKVFVNAKTKQPVLYVTNHEVIHTLETTAPESHARLMQIVKEHIADQEGITQHYLEQGYGLDDVHRELTSDTMAEVMLQPNFWSRVREKSPELLKPILDAIDKIVANFKAKVGDDMTVLPYLKDVETMRTRLADEYQGYLSDIKVGKIQKPGEGVAAKQEVSYKLGEQNKAPADELKDIITYGAEQIRNGNKAGFEKSIKEQFSNTFNGYSPEMQKELINNLFVDAQKLVKEKNMTLDIGKGKTLSIDLPDLKGKQPRKLGLSAIKAPWAKDEYAQGVKAEITPEGRGAYDPISNKQTLADAEKALQDDSGAVVRRILSDAPADRIDNTAGLLLVKQANETGDIGLAVDLTESLAKKATESGQAIQALSMWGRLTPEGMLSYAQKVIARANYDLSKSGVKKNIKLDEGTAQKIVDLMKQAEGLEGRAKDIKTAQALDLIASQVPSSTLRKISTLQTMAQLLNPKTAIRNLVGNTGFLGMENISDVVGVGLDRTTGLITGNRTKVLPSLTTQAKGAKTGFKLGLEDALLKIDTSNMAGGKFDIPTTRTFRKGVLGKLETGMNIELRATDRAFYQAAYDESLRQQTAAAAKSKNPPTTEQMKEAARYDALYRTFQDDSVAARLFTTIKRGLNFGKEFGLGDFILKYPKTPANLLSRGIEYSPAGFVKTVLELGKPLMGKEFNQKAFVEGTSRALVGSAGLVGTGSILHKLGIITGKQNDDYDVENLNAQAGYGAYKINVSALKRFITSGFDVAKAKLQKGDTLVSYDWFQPDSIGLAMGADIDANKNQKKGITAKLGSLLSMGAGGLFTGINTLADQPVVQGVQQLFASGQSGDISAGILKTLEGVPASFVPTLFNQVKQLMDNQKRSTYSPNYFEEMKNKTTGKLPGMASKLPASYGTLGQPLQTYQDKNNLFNVFFNPSFVSKYNPSPEAEKVLNLYNETGDQTIFPRTVQKYITFTPSGGKQSERIDLTSQEYSEYQRLTGLYAQQGLSKASDNMTVKQAKAILDDAAEKAKKDILAGRGLKMKTK